MEFCCNIYRNNIFFRSIALKLFVCIVFKFLIHGFINFVACIILFKGIELWQLVSNLLEGKSIAVLGRIQKDGFRTPNAKVMYGPSPWIEHVDNGIK